ncbi:WD domain, G-beta repeat [Anatilimnocola aggregata]|uniref:WD domain, G-beta repeat n=1 Tax=Anatilimnocola aggregata TaxID=2528021 RepID=A0A517Y4J4_9BACT|nr:WD40 repeat domain-containing protein [Anatilimnocola aggregata]QDU25164.1 WD domain, G-beta repeat [Anatilimnocola aggregata]
MPSIHRRRFLLAAAATLSSPWLLPLSSAQAQAPGITDISARLDWPARVVQLKADPDELTPPVITALEIHREGQVIATAGDDHIVRIYSLNDGSQVQRLEAHADWVRTIDYSLDGSLLASAGNDRRVLLWPTTADPKPRQFVVHEQAIASVKFSDDATKLAVVGFEQAVRLYRVSDGELLWQAAGPCNDLRTVVFAPDQKSVAVAGRCGSIRLLSVADGRVIRDFVAHKQRVRALEFSPDGSFLASVGEDRTIHIQPLSDGAVGKNLPQRPVKVLSATFYAPGKLAVGGSDNLVRLWDVIKHEEVGLLTGHTGSVAALGAKGTMLASAGYDTTLRLWTITENIAGAPAAAGTPRVGTAPSLPSFGLPPVNTR